jgi:hypothetical protein
LDKGLVFFYQRDLVVTGNFWNVVNLNLKWWRFKLDLIDVILKQVETYQKNPRSVSAVRYVKWKVITYLHAVWKELNLELENMERLLPLA